MESEKLIRIIENSFRCIDFTNRYKKTMENHSDFENRMQKIDKKEILKALKELGYTFKVFSPGQDFYIEDVVLHFKFIFSFKAKNAIMENYIHVYMDEKKIPFLYPNLAFVYRFLVGDMTTSVKAQNFKNYEEFKTIISTLLNIYEDFKSEFLRQVEQLEKS